MTTEIVEKDIVKIPGQSPQENEQIFTITDNTYHYRGYYQPYNLPYELDITDDQLGTAIQVSGQIESFIHVNTGHSIITTRKISLFKKGDFFSFETIDYPETNENNKHKIVTITRTDNSLPTPRFFHKNPNAS
jgi:hypothetical protein